MAWSSAVMSATVRALLAANKPLLIGNNVLRARAASFMQWRTSGSWASGSNGTATAAPSSYLTDGYLHLACAANAAQTTWYLIIDLGGLVTFDSVALLDHNFDAIGGLTVSLEVADANAYASAQQIATWSPGTSNKQLVNVAMDHTGGAQPRQYTAQYVRLKLTKGSAFTPQIGELFLSTRRQLKHAPSIPYDPSHLRSYVDEFTSTSRITTRYVQAQGQRILNAELNPSETAYQDDLYSFWTSDIADGTLPFLWLPTPNSNPQDAPLMLCPTELQFPWQGPSERALTLVASEQGAQFVRQES